MRARSSSRCSTSVASSPCRRRRGRRFIVLGGVALALARCDGRVCRLYRELCRLVIVVVLAADLLLELAETAAHRASDLGQPLGPEQQKSQEKQKDDLPRANVGHARRVAVWRPRCGKDAPRDGTQKG